MFSHNTTPNQEIVGDKKQSNYQQTFRDFFQRHDAQMNK